MIDFTLPSTIEWPQHLFITGTNTGVGKTVVTGLIAKHLQTTRQVITQKWVQTGCTAPIPEDLNTHWVIRQRGTAALMPYLADCCPYQFAYPASPHLAAHLENTPIHTEKIYAAFYRLANQFDTVICEGAGGILVPVTPTETVLDCVSALNLPTVIVIGNTLGCINHSLLTIQALRAAKVPLMGLVFNHVPVDTPAPIAADNMAIIQAKTHLPILFSVPDLGS
ncbi:dethiobiotin synthase [bacterium]|nr:dethiobiotin synthase [bacterium]|tara:strand:+ start:2720 stop:3388 length:669 start_codon:yes stop_codon:yes gene_type:complete